MRKSFPAGTVFRRAAMGKVVIPSIVFSKKRETQSSSVPMSEADVHLMRLLVETDEGWYVSLKNNIKWLFARKEPPLQVTSKPIPVQDIWGDYRYGKISGPLSLLLHGLLIAVLVVSGRIVAHEGRKIMREIIYNPTDISAYLPPSVKPAGGGGGGGERSPEPASVGRLPKFAMEQLAPPTVIIRNENPKLAVEPTVIVPPDIRIPQPNVAQLGDPLGALGPPSSGPGAGSGIGSGYGGGVGSGRGGGVGPGEGGGFGGGAFRVGGGVTAPVPIYRVEPEYTEEARKAKYQGTVVLYCVVDPDGLVRNVRVMRSLGLGLDEKAVEAVKQWKFRPGMKDGRPVPVTASIEVTFRLL